MVVSQEVKLKRVSLESILTMNSENTIKWTLCAEDSVIRYKFSRFERFLKY